MIDNSTENVLCMNTPRLKNFAQVNYFPDQQLNKSHFNTGIVTIAWYTKLAKHSVNKWLR